MRVVVTRPQEDAQAWVRKLTQGGLDAVALPLIDIQPVQDTQAVRSAWQRLPQYTGVMFVSGHAAAGFFAARPPEAKVFCESARAWATGPGTRDALLRLGVREHQIDAPEVGQFDSEALWKQVKNQVRPGTRVLIVRGADSQPGNQSQGLGRDWFAAQVLAQGAQVDHVVAYQRRVPVWSEQQKSLARATALDGSVWLLSSSEAVANLGVCLPSQDWSLARAVATHARIAAAARQAGFGVVLQTRPLLPEILASIESLR